ncbi:MAG: regulator [Coxiella sp. DG_40]|nr:MAG: regulator [Coxiella sp. DG_40]
MRILLVEDDELLGDGLRAGLIQHKYTVDWIKDGQAALQALTTDHFAVVILDLGLPKCSGLDVLKSMRNKGINTPVLILTARDGVEDFVKGLDTGADDYLAKPFDLDELCARIRALQRRGSSGRSKPIIHFGTIKLDPASHSVYKDGKKVIISRREFVLLHTLLDNPGRVLSREHLTQNLYGWEGDVDSNALEVHVHNLRKKFGNKLITTIRGVGYMVEKGE